MTQIDVPHVRAGGRLGKPYVGIVASKYLLVIAENVIGYVWLEPAAACMSAVTAEILLRWCTALGVPGLKLSDAAWHFMN